MSIVSTTSGQITIFILSIGGLWLGSRLLVDAAVVLARRRGISELVIGLTIVAVGTSTPELVVSADATVSGFGSIAVANVLGSNIFNLALILGGVSLLQAVPVERSLIHRDGIALLGATAVVGTTLLMLGGTIDRVHGLAFLLLLGGYMTVLIHTERSHPSMATEYSNTPEIALDVIAEWIPLPEVAKHGFILLCGLIIVLVSGHYLVSAAVAIATAAGISEWVIGETIVAAGTSTPELVVSIIAARSGHIGMAVGNVFGSCIFNLLGILGVAAILNPLVVGNAAVQTLGWLSLVSIAMVVALWSGNALSRVEGLVFVSAELIRWGMRLIG